MLVRFSGDWNTLSMALNSFVRRIVAANQPLELTKGKAGEIMLVRQSAVNEAPVNLKRTATVVRAEAATPQSVREVLINSLAEPQHQEQHAGKAINLSHLEDAAGSMEAAGGGGLPFHPQNPEGSMIKELLLKTKLNGLVPVVPPSGLSVSVSNTTATLAAPAQKRIAAVAGASEGSTYLLIILLYIILQLQLLT